MSVHAGRMRLRAWGIGLLILGTLAILGGIVGGIGAWYAWNSAEAACLGSTDPLCGAGKTYLAAVLMVVAPLLAVPGMLLVVAGGIVLAIARKVEAVVGQGLAALATAFR